MDFFKETPFNDALKDLRISGNVLLHESYAASWIIEIPGEKELQNLVGVEPDVRILPFHLVQDGSFDLAIRNALMEKQGAVHVDVKDLVICPSGMPHQMSSILRQKPAPKAVSLADIINGNGPAIAKQGEPATELICGVFQLHSMPLNPLLAALPSVLKVKTEGDKANPMLVHAAKMLTMGLNDNQPSNFITSRVLEVFCAEAIYAYCQDTANTAPGWFKALNDPKIAVAITHIHQQPGALWTVASLAEKVNMSVSRFAARFREITNQSVMSYVAQWRMNVACRLLQETDESLAIIADKIGYSDVASFSRAFKDLVGNSPARWRTQKKTPHGTA